MNLMSYFVEQLLPRYHTLIVIYYLVERSTPDTKGKQVTRHGPYISKRLVKYNLLRDEYFQINYKRGVLKATYQRSMDSG